MSLCALLLLLSSVVAIAYVVQFFLEQKDLTGFSGVVQIVALVILILILARYAFVNDFFLWG